MVHVSRKRPSLNPWRLAATRMLAEFCGTAILVSVGCLGGLVAQQSSAAPVLQASLHYGGVFAGVVHCFGSISGAHVNPNITLTHWYLQRITLTQLVTYLVAQFVGAMCGYGLLALLATRTILLAGTPVCMAMPDPDLNFFEIMAIEFMLTLFLLIGSYSTLATRNSHNLDEMPLRMGALMSCLCLVGATLTGGCMNPAVSVVFSLYHSKSDLLQLFPYCSGQFLATLVASIIWRIAYYTSVNH